MKNASKRICGWIIGSTVLLLIVFFITNTLQAQDDALMAKINTTREFVIKQAAASDYRDSIRKSVLEYEGSLSTHCKSVDLEFDSVAVRIRILMPLEMNDKDVPVSGRWKETVPGTACNEKRMYNVQVDVTKTGLHFTPTYPGTAQGNPELQHDTLKNIEMVLMILPGAKIKRSCRADVLDTQLVGPAATFLDNGLLSPWNEAWDVRACGKLFTVPVKYIPDAKGTAISIGVTEIKAH
jgi:hypothetical protein